MDTQDLLLEHYLAWMKSTSKKQTVKEFSEHLGLGYKLFAQLFNGTRQPTKKQTSYFATFFGDQRFFDAVGLPRDDPQFQYVQRHWGELPDVAQKQITDLLSQYTTDPKPANKHENS